MKTQRPIRVLLAKTGVDGHDRGVKVLAKGLLQEGMEVIYLGLYQPEEAVIATAIDEDVDVIGLSLLGGEHLTRGPKMAAMMKEAGLDDVVLLVGGTIPLQHIDKLKEAGVDEAFPASTLVPEVAEWIRAEVPKRRKLGR